MFLTSRGIGYPLLWPSADCRQPLDVSNDFTFKVIDGILSGDNAFLTQLMQKYLLEIRFSEISQFPDFSKVFKYKFVHLGGDEVDTSEFFSCSYAKLFIYYSFSFVCCMLEN